MHSSRPAHKHNLNQTPNPFGTGAGAGVLRGGVACIVALLCFLAIGGRLAAQDSPEAIAFKAAGSVFQDGAYELAERSFSQFVANYPQSPMLAEAILLQARAAMELGRLSDAVTLLNASLTKTGPLADQYRYRIGEAHMRGSNFLAAAESFASVTRDFTNSPLLLEASHEEARARFKVRDFARVVALLQNPDGAFQRAARLRPADAFTARSRLLLGEALFEQQKPAEAEQAVAALEESDLVPDLKWDRQYLLCRILLADRRLAEALTGSTNLISLALGTAQRELQADSFALQASILRQLDRSDDAIQVYTNNLADAVPADRRRLALLNIIDVKLAQEKLTEAAQALDSFLARHPEDAASDVALLTLGEIHLRLHVTSTNTNVTNGAAAILPAAFASVTNRLPQAIALFDRVIALTNSALRGKAFLNKGWCLWLDQKIDAAATSFKAAVELLPRSEDAAVARFKLADALFAQGDLTNALAHYRAVVEEASSLPRVRTGLLPQASYQIVRTAVQAGDLSTADDAMRKILDDQPDSLLAERSLLLVGQSLNDAREPAQARRLYAEFARRFTTSSLLPRVEFELARTHTDAGDWPAARAGYERWLDRHATHELRSQAEFSLAWSHWRAGSETNALNLFTNFVGHHPTGILAATAQFWVGDHFMRQGDLFNAQSAYQRIVENTNWPVTDITYRNLAYRARFAAGRAAFRRQDWNGAGGRNGHFTLLFNDDNCPKHIMAEACLELGNTKIFLPLDDESPQQTEIDRALARQAEARRTFEKIPLLFATNQLARHLIPVAWGRIGDCSLQLASRDPRQYDIATNAYWRVVTNDTASAGLRQMAAHGIGRALALQAFDLQTRAGPSPEVTNLLTAALEQFYNVVLSAGPLAMTDPDPIWLKEAGLAGAKLAEERRQWKIAASLYERLSIALPPLQPRLQDKLDKAREQLRLEGN